ncbi:MAG: signal peptidase I [Clostridia bacterium]|nr:signal peptidase I [Clostridia bacterium]
MFRVIEIILNSIKNVILIILAIIFIALLILFMEKFLFKVEYPSVNGITAFIVRTESMYPVLLTNDIVLVDLKDDNYQVNDILSYKSENYVITHRLIQIDNDKLILRGDANNSNDPEIDKKDVVGKVVRIVPNLRIWINVLKDIKVIICIILTLVLYITINILKFIEEKMNGKEEKIFKN